MARIQLLSTPNCTRHLSSEENVAAGRCVQILAYSAATFRQIMSGCDEHEIADFSRVVGGQTLQVNALLIGNTILMGVMVGIGAYGHHYRHHPLTRFLFLGATILFLPIVSYIVSITNNQNIVTVLSSRNRMVTGLCRSNHRFMVLLCATVVQIVGINTTAIVAADVREGRSIPPPTVLLVQAIWTTYLGFNIIKGPNAMSLQNAIKYITLLAIFSPFPLIFAKIVLKYYAWYHAKQSFAFGRNPRLIVGYMEQLPDRSYHAEVAGEYTPPLLIVSREDTMLVEKQPHGYRMCNTADRTRINNNADLVTIDKVWELDVILLKSKTQFEDLCFSFALFKMLRCRFAKYTVTEAGFMKAQNFLWHVLLEDSGDTQILGVIASELSFLHDYYYSSLPISYSKSWIPIWSISISILSIGYCLFITMILMAYLVASGVASGVEWQVLCQVNCMGSPYGTGDTKHFGSVWFDVLPLLSLGALVMLSEAREIASYICSDWTKVALLCHYISSREYPTLPKWIGLLLQCRCKLVEPWQDKMSQCSILVLRRRKTPLAILRRPIPLPEQKKNVKVPREVKAAIVNTLRSIRGDLRNGMMSLQQLGIQVGGNFLQACNAKGTSDALLSWHIATSIFEVRYPHSTTSGHASVATHLSRYCAYLVSYSPELLPNDDAWSNSMYKATKKDAERVLSGRIAKPTPELQYRHLVELLTARSKHEVLKDGAKLGEQLVEFMEGEEASQEELLVVLLGWLRLPRSFSALQVIKSRLGSA
ncbi:hypothetical protein CFC21_099826 [Triticum aestivum]|uniref:DUF4220 domain-containing protein n=2 Tax=Triticum aestivum TaxID=4565 RepID=A0A3B6RMG7_WHEAT|nr:hypothetical protein CFC21_099826 [Triticum aestivum]